MTRTLRVSLWPGPGNSWAETLDLCRHAEASGWDGAWYADHFMPNAEDVSGPTNECFTTLAGLAAAVPRIRLGSLVAGNTYRHPAVLAKMAAGIDNISGG
ncbi:MAG: LLM class flavin-dependent oxidoreductase, partial [Chloroflexi bacterium CFX7]|nr:LLM class flavin-dependent oxidoreductase [Chloroflexi bacterium CFX7]